MLFSNFFQVLYGVSGTVTLTAITMKRPQVLKYNIRSLKLPYWLTGQLPGCQSGFQRCAGAFRVCSRKATILVTDDDRIPVISKCRGTFVGMSLTKKHIYV